MVHPRMLAVSVILLALSLPCLADESEQEPSTVQSARSRIEPYVDWLPRTSETLVVLNQLYQIPPEPGGKASFGTMPFDAIFHEVCLLHMFEGDARDMLAGKLLKLGIEASSGFHFPRFPEEVRDVAPSIGVVSQYDGCNVLVFDACTPVDTTELFEKLLQQHPEPTSHIPAASRNRIEGFETIAYSTSPPEFNQGRATSEQKKLIDAALSMRYWIASPKENVLVVATSADVLAETLRKVEKPDESAFPASLKEWECVRGEMPIWGMRHYSLSERWPGDHSDLREEKDDHLSGFTFAIDGIADKAELTFVDCSPGIIRHLKSSLLRYGYSKAEFSQEAGGRLMAHMDWSRETPDNDIEIEGELAGWLIIHLGRFFAI